MHLMTIFGHLDRNRSKTVDANEFLDLVVPRLSGFQENCVLAIMYTINHKIQHLSKTVNNSKTLHLWNWFKLLLELAIGCV